MSKQLMTEIETYNWLKGKVHSTQIEWGTASIAVQICEKTDAKVAAFLKSQGFIGRGTDTIMGMKFEWMVKDFRPMTEYEALTM